MTSITAYNSLYYWKNTPLLRKASENRLKLYQYMYRNTHIKTDFDIYRPYYESSLLKMADQL